MANVGKDMGKLKKDFEKREADLAAIYRSVNTKLGVE